MTDGQSRSYAAEANSQAPTSSTLLSHLGNSTGIPPGASAHTRTRTRHFLPGPRPRVRVNARVMIFVPAGIPVTGVPSGTTAEVRAHDEGVRASAYTHTECEVCVCKRACVHAAAPSLNREGEDEGERRGQGRGEEEWWHNACNRRGGGRVRATAKGEGGSDGRGCARAAMAQRACARCAVNERGGRGLRARGVAALEVSG